MLIAAACSSGSAPADGDAIPAAAGSELTATLASFELAPEGTDLEALLERIPALDEAREGFLVNDFAARRSQAGVNPPAQDGEFTELARYLAGLTGFPGRVVDLQIAPFSWISGVHRFVEMGTTFPYLGFDGRNTDQVVVIGSPSTRLFEIVRGSYDPRITEATLNACQICRPGRKLQHAGASFYAWGEDYEADASARFSPPAYDDQGRGGRIWVDSGFAVRTLTIEDMEAAIDAGTGAAASLGDEEVYRLAARALSAFNIVDATFSQAKSGLADLASDIADVAVLNRSRGLLPEDAADVLADPVLLKPFELAATGTGFDDGDIFTALVLVHPDEESAAANIERLVERIATGRQPFGGRAWDKVIERIEIGSNGRLLLARLYSHRGRVPLLQDQQNGAGFNPLLVHE